MDFKGKLIKMDLNLVMHHQQVLFKDLIHLS
jgi:hypothetical protein